MTAKVLLVLLLVLLNGCSGRRHKRSAEADKPHQTVWYTRGQEELKNALKMEGKEIRNKAKNIVLVIGDGMGVSTVTAARWYKSLKEKTPIGDTRLSWEELPYLALSKTHNANNIVPDSAGTATAIMSGEKAWSGVLGLNHRVPNKDCHAAAGNEVKSAMHYAMQQGKATGLVTTVSITHATPAAAYAHSPHRGWYRDSKVPDECKNITKDIALQLIEDNPNINVLFGGGRLNFLSKNMADPVESDRYGRRTDGLNLIQEWKKHKMNKGLEEKKYKTVFKPQDFDNLDANEVDYVLGLMGYDDLGYNYQLKDGQPSLAEMTEKALTILQKNDRGYFLMVEDGHIDWAHHENKAQVALDDVLAMERTVRVIMDKTDPEDTLLIVTADHSHVFTIAGYTSDNATSIIGYDSGQFGLDGKPYLTMGYRNGPGFQVHRMENGTEIPRKNIKEFGDEMYKMEYISDAGVNRRSETHGGEEVPIYARGPWSHLFHATHDQTYIGHVMMHAGCFTKTSADHCIGRKSVTPSPLKCGGMTATLALSIITVILGVNVFKTF